jgi:hypothetical protein
MAAQSHSTVLAELKSNVSALEAAHSNTNTHLIDVHKGTEPLCRKIDDLEMRVSAHFLNLENQVQADQVDKGRRLDTLESLMGSFVLQFSDGRPPSTSTSVERRLIGTLVSKPSLLKDIHDTVDSVPYESHEMVHQKPKDPWSGYLRAVPPEIDPWYQITCICKPQQTVQRFSTRWPSFTFTSTTVIKSKHHSTCPLHKAVRRKRKQQYEVTFTGLRNLLNTAVTAGFSLSFGAGGCSIAPSFQYFAMVDEAQSPAFRIIGEVATVMGGWHSELNEKTINAVLVHALSRLNAIYIKRTASPSDVNHAGETVMDALFTKVR